MKMQTIINSVITSGLLFAGVAFASSTQNSETDLIYGNSSVITSQGEAFVAAPAVQNNLATDMIYGEQKWMPTPGEAARRYVDNRNSNTDIIYGSCEINAYC